MQLGKGVEWCTHICGVLTLVPEGKGLSAEALADFFEVPGAYLAKQMQLMRRAGIVESLRGKGGGYRLARGVDAITLLDIVQAIEGQSPAFRCTEIRQNGPCGMKRADCKSPCEIALAFAEAENVYRETLRAKTLAAINMEAAVNGSPEHFAEIAQWVQKQVA